ncbi:MAG: hypothetical protein RSE44_29180, partial [Pseudomonas sp.]
NAKELQGRREVTLADLMDPQFISSHSKFPDLNALFAASGFKVETPEDFAAIPDDQWDDFISEHTNFSSWLEMQKAANAAYVKAQLNKGIKG